MEKTKYFLKVSQLNKKDLLAEIFKIFDKTFNVLFFIFIYQHQYVEKLNLVLHSNNLFLFL